MLLDICLGTRSAWKILLLLSETPGKMVTRKQIQEHTKIGNKALVKFLLLLEKFDLIQTSKTGRKHFYKLNMQNPYTNAIIDLINVERRQLNAVYFSHLLVLREFVYELTNLDFENILKIFLFGSVAKHTARIDSDIDLAIVTKGKISPREQLLHIDLIERLKKRFVNEIQVHYFTEEEFEKLRRAGNKLVTEIVTDGLVLAG